MARSFGASSGGINLRADRAKPGEFLVTYNYTHDLVERYKDHGYLEDLTLPRIFEHTGRPVLVSDMLQEVRYGSHRFHEEFISRRKTDHLLAVAVELQGMVAVIRLSRTSDLGPFEESHLEQLQQLLPHIARSIGLTSAVAARRSEKTNSAARIIDYLRLASFQLSGQGQLLSLNRAAQRLIDTGSHFRLREGRLELADAGEQARYASLLAESIFTRATRPQQMLVRSGNDAQMLLRFWVDPPSRQCDEEVQVNVLAAAGAVDGDGLETYLRSIFKLTASEARTTLAVLSAQGLASAAKRDGVSLETVRYHLKNVFAKTGTRRQSELISLLATSFGMFLD